MTSGASRNGAPLGDGGELRRRTRRRTGAGCARSIRPKAAASQNSGGAAVAEHDLVAVGQGEELGQPGAHAADHGLHRRLAVRRARGSVPAAASGADRLGPHLGRPAAEAAVGRAAGRPGSRICGGSGAITVPAWQSVSRISARIAAITESATLAVDAKAKALKAPGEDVIGFGAGEPDFPTPAAHRRGRRRPPAATRRTTGTRRPAGLPELREAIAAKTTRDSGYDVPGRQGPGHQRRQARRLQRLRQRCATPATRCSCPAPYWTTYPEAIAPGRRRAGRAPHRRADRLPGHRRAARGGPHRPHQGAAVRVARQPDAAPSTRPTRSRPSGAGPSSTASGSSPTRSTSTSPTATTQFTSMPALVPELADTLRRAQRRGQDLRHDGLAGGLDASARPT